ncbi:hypothetical protein [Smaragdicoccus niigatensis]|uniref:hypothetical protein n=1 Tax=Smaragdicoccus niigatensis TaxID=359359 RepID=UPI00037851A4|nr:hypothetical protein [Smaragdicoccus niigatensis]
MQNTFPNPSDVVSGLRLMYADAYDSGPHDTLFSLLLHSNGQLAGVASVPAHASDDTLRDCAQEAHLRAAATSTVLVAVSNRPMAVLRGAAGFYVEHPQMLIGVDSLQSGSWTEYISGTSGRIDRSAAIHAGNRFLGHWEFCTFSETFSRDKWSFTKPTKFKSIETPLERFTRSISAGRSFHDHSRTGGLLIYSEHSRDEAIRAIDINPARAMEIFAAAAKDLSEDARIEAVVAAGVAAFFAGKRCIAEHAYLVAGSESKEHPLRFDERMLAALGALVTGEVSASSASELVRLFAPVSKTA